MPDRPTLPELPYVLWLPALGAYVQKARRLNRRIITTNNRAAAACFPYVRARETALALIRATGQVIELRDAQPGRTA